MSEFEELEKKFKDFENKLNAHSEDVIKKKEDTLKQKDEVKKRTGKDSSKMNLSNSNSVKNDSKINDIEQELKQLEEKLLNSKTESYQNKESSNDSVKINSSSFKPKQSSSDDVVLSIMDTQRYSTQVQELLNEISKKVIGQEDIVTKILISLLCDGHSLLEGVPGLAKSLLVEVLSNVIDGTSFNRIQFIPDLLPSDIIGGQIYNPRTSQFKVFKGPIFANFILADEINRAPPKTHAALMECMQEKKVNIDKEEFILDRPFLVLATMNPLENKGTYQLPEAILDRFIFKIIMDYPTKQDEMRIITENATTKNNYSKANKTLLSKRDLLLMQRDVKKVFISDKIKSYILDLISASRGLNKDIEGRKFIKYGGGPRASIYLGVASKAAALLDGRNYVLPKDVKFVFPAIMRHRICLNYKGKAHSISSDKIIQEILLTIKSV